MTDNKPESTIIDYIDLDPVFLLSILKKYSIYLYALSSKLTLSATEATESSLLTAMTGKVISSASLDVFYSRT